ncbi:MAG: TIGR00366 family protein [Saprospiraceae bacterium]|nr:TIGR00366 family protein [Saprospiraceae bacterium]
MQDNSEPSKAKKWYERIPHAITILFGIIVFVTVLTYLIPAGTFERTLVDGRQRVIPGSYKVIDSTPVNLLSMFKAIPLGFKAAIEIIFIVLAGGIMFGIMEKSKAVENAIGTLVNSLGVRKRFTIVILMTFVYGLLGVAVGYENNIAMVPIAAVLSLALGGDLILAAGISVGAMTIGFGLSPINPYTVGTGHKIAGLTMFSGAILRSILCFIGLSIMAYYNVRYFKKIISNKNKSLSQGLDTEGLKLSKPLKEYSMSTQNNLVILTFLVGLGVILFGVFNYEWKINELSAVFLMIALVCGIIAKMSPNTFSEHVLTSVSYVAPGAFMVGFATTIKVLMEMGNIGDTISHNLAELLQGLPLYASAISMSVAQCVINLFIPSGSGQALATLPVMLPLGEVLGLTSQTTILAFQIGDGVTNLVNPTLGGLIAMLSMCRVPLDRWIRFIFPVVGMILIISWIFLLLAVSIGYS